MNLTVVGQAVCNGVVMNVDSGTSMTFDRGNPIRRIASISLTETSTTGVPLLVPTGPTSLLAPYGNEITLYYGLQYADGSQELIPVGVFGIESTAITDSATDLTLTLNVQDRARSYQRAGFGDVYVVGPSLDVGGAIAALLNAIGVGFQPLFNFASTFPFTTPLTPTVYMPGDDPWAAATALADSAGCELFHDPLGTCVLLPVPNPQTQAVVWSYDEGALSTDIDLTRTLSRTAAFNNVIRDGQGSGVTVPVRGISADTNPASPTWVGGAYGVQTDYATSSLYTTPGMAQAAAAATLLTALGSVETLSLDVIPKPDHDVDDVIEVTRVRAGIPSGSRYVLDSGTLGFGSAGTLALAVRAIGGILAPVTG